MASPSTSPSATLTASEAVTLLGVSRQTLYAYVSRGLLRTLPGDTPRERRYWRHEVMQLLAQRRRGRKVRDVAQSTLDWGVAVMPSAITLIEQGALYYRGRSAVQMAEEYTLEQTAAWLWQQAAWQVEEVEDKTDAPVAQTGPSAEPETLLTRFVIASQALAEDADWCSPTRQVQIGGQLLACMAECVSARRSHGQPIHMQCATAWGLPPRQADWLRMALVLCADHELNPSSFSARCASASGASTRAALVAALATLSGARHGGATARVAALYAEMSAGTCLAQLRAKLQRGDTIAGFGHPLYPQGDPRARQLLQALPPEALTEEIIAAMVTLTGHAPSLDFALVALCRALGLPDGSAFALFALGRTAGWIAHILEQRSSGHPIRPRAQYCGPRPVD